jgi:hypothetical protein
VSELTTKLPYKKLQYPTYVKDTNSDVHIRMFKKTIKANGETIEFDIINMLVSLSGILSFNGEKTTFKTIQIALLKSWNKDFVSDSE